MDDNEAENLFVAACLGASEEELDWVVVLTMSYNVNDVLYIPYLCENLLSIG